MVTAPRHWILAELVAVLIAVVLTWLGVYTAVDQALALVDGLDEVRHRSPEEVRQAAEYALWRWTAAVGVLAAARLRSAGRPGLHLSAPLILPALVALTGLGLALQLSYGDPLRPEVWTAPRFADGIAIGVGLVALALLPTWSLDRLLADRRLRWLSAGAIVVTVVALRWGPLVDKEAVRLTGQYINLKITASKAVQPLEAVKMAFALLVALSVAEHAAKLQTHRVRFGPVTAPRAGLLLGAAGLLLLILGGIFLLRDLGMSVVVALLWVLLLHAAVGDRRWALAGVGVIAMAVAAVCIQPELVGGYASERVQMWLEPWTNGQARGMQAVQALWAIALGGLLGRGLGAADPGALPEGHTDLVLAHLAEALGLLGGLAYLLLLGTLALQALWIGARARTLQRGLIAVACGGLLLAQWLVIFGGTVGWLPLTGIVVPYLSRGMSSGAVFVLIGALPLLVAEDGAPRGRPAASLERLRRSVVDLAAVATVLLVAGGVRLAWLGVVRAPELLARPVVVTVGRTGEVKTVVLRYARAIEQLTRRLHRGPVLAAGGEVLRGVDEEGAWSWPRGPIIGTRLGPPSDLDGRLARGWWQVERQFEGQLSGLQPLPSWTAFVDTDGTVRTVAKTDEEREAARATFGDEARAIALPRQDVTALVPMARMRPADQAEAIAAWNAAPEQRAVQTTLVAELQAAAHAACIEGAKAGTGCAVAVIEVDTGAILAVAQAPDLDLPALMSDDGRGLLDLRRRTDNRRYDPWNDLAGPHAGVVALGSSAKILTTLAWLRTHDPEIRHLRDDAWGGGPWSCSWEDGRPAYGEPDWAAPIRSHAGTSLARGDLTSMLQHSSNCISAQVGLEAGPEAFRQLVCDGVEVGHVKDCADFDPGAAGSRRLGLTSIGQGAMEMNVLQAARMIAMTSDGVYRRCPDIVSPADGGPACETHLIHDDTDELQLLLHGLYRVGHSGTASGALKHTPTPELRVYPKTGTADAKVTESEGEVPTCKGGPCPHSWFTLLAEPGSAPKAAAGTPGRLAVAAVVFRGGSGAGPAAKVALTVTNAARDLGLLQDRAVGSR